MPVQRQADDRWPQLYIFMESKFRWTAYCVPLVFVFAIFVLLMVFGVFFSQPVPVQAKLVSTLFMALFLLVAFGEMRKKAVTLNLYDECLTIKPFLGLARPVKYDYVDLQGFATRLVFMPNRGLYEYMYLLRNDKVIYSISEYYHANYEEMKAELAKSLPYLGKRNLTLRQEIRYTYFE